MAFYIGNGEFFIRKDEAKKVDKDYVEVEFPTKQAEICEFLNKLVASVRDDAEAGQIVAEDVPSSPAIKVTSLAELFTDAPLTSQLDLVVGAIDRFGAYLRGPLNSALAGTPYADRLEAVESGEAEQATEDAEEASDGSEFV